MLKQRTLKTVIRASGVGLHGGELAADPAQGVASLEVQRVGDYMLTALRQLVSALQQAPTTPLEAVSIVPAAERQQLLARALARLMHFSWHESRRNRSPVLSQPASPIR